jgi:hypothetical protein
MRSMMLAIIAAGTLGTALLGADPAWARAGATGASRGGSVHRGTAISPRSGVGRHSRAVHGRGAPFRRPGLRGRPFWASGVSASDAGLPGYEYVPGVPPNCQVQRVQIDDDWGWRVRDVVVCP